MKRSLLAAVLLLCMGATDDDNDGCGPSKRSRAALEQQAEAFAAKRSARAPRAVECMAKDTDDDGYVTCTVFEEDGQMYDIECAYKTDNSGCKPKRDKVRVK